MRLLNFHGIGMPERCKMVVVQVFDILSGVRRRHCWEIKGELFVTKRGDVLMRRARRPAKDDRLVSACQGPREEPTSHESSWDEP
jgi:hypothetical protein